MTKAKKIFVSYEQAGVSILRGNAFASAVGEMAKEAARKEVVSGIGGFASLFKLDTERYPDPLLCAATDGVGTKLKLAFAADKHDTVGIDLVAMSVNDLICSGAEPLFFLDYFGTGKLEPKTAKQVLKGVVKGCLQSGCALIGGETAEMPSMYPDGEYDLAGFAVGVVNKGEELPKKNIKAGDFLLGIPSNGLHSNGFSLIRKIFLEKLKLGIHDRIPGTRSSLYSVFLKPTKIYVDLFLKWRDAVDIKALAHITGGGIAGNLARVLPQNVKAVVNTLSWRQPMIYKSIQDLGPVTEEELYKTFNMGIGLVAVVSMAQVEKAIYIARELGYKPVIIGKLQKSKGAPTVELQ